jgi:filamentous hemagglutinin family protein
LQRLAVIGLEVSLLLGTSLAYANPEDGRVVRGSATITTDGSVVTITQTSKKAVIDWQRFSIGGSETVRFQQPNAKALAVNRVTGAERSTIDGQLQANGRLVLSNPNGITFGPGARVDVAGLVATTARLADRDLDAGMNDDVWRFTDAPPGSAVVNQGSISIADSGLAALVAPWVANDGVITARLGRVRLASGSAFTIDLYGDELLRLAVDDRLAGELGAAPDSFEARVEQRGRITAGGGLVALEVATARDIVDRVINLDGIVQVRAVQQDGGQIVLRGGETGAVDVAGTLDASGRGQDQRGGQIFVLGDDIGLGATARLDVAGELLAGAITVAGGTGPNGFLPARIVTLDGKATIDLRTFRTGDGGRVVTVADATPPQGTGLDGDLDQLQEVVDDLLPEAEIDVSQDAFRLVDDSLPRAATITVVDQFASFAPTNVYGIYDVEDPESRFTLLGPGTVFGDEVSFQLLDRADGTVDVFVDGRRLGRLSGTDYGFFVDSTAGVGGGLVFSDSGMNPGAEDQLGSYAVDAQTTSEVPGTPESLRGRLQGVGDRVQAWEDLVIAPGLAGFISSSTAALASAPQSGSGSDQDFDDLVLKLNPGGKANFITNEIRDPPPPGTNPPNDRGPDVQAGNCATNPAACRDFSNDDDQDGRQGGGQDDDEVVTADACNSWRLDQTVSDAAVARCYAALALDAIAVHASTSFAALVAALDDPSPISRARAVSELGEIGAYLSAAVPVLIEALVTDDDRVARLAERVLDDADGFARDVVPALGRATRDPDDRVVRNAAVALGDLGAYATPALPVLDDTLDHVDIVARFNAAEGIAKVDAEMRATTLALARIAGEGETLDRLELALGQDRSPFRSRAVGTLAAVSDETRDAAAATLPSLAAADPAERALAVGTLGELERIGGAALPVLVQAVALPESRDLRASLGSRTEGGMPFDEPALRPLLQALNDRDPAVRRAAATALATLAATASSSRAELADLPRDDATIRRFTGRAETVLAGFAPAVLPALEPAAGDEDPLVRGAAVTAIGHLGSDAEPAVPLLVDALAGTQSDLHRPAATALGRIGAGPEAAVAALADRLFDPDPRVACEAARALGLFADAARPASGQLLAAAEADQTGPGFCAGVALFAIDPPLARDFWPPELADFRADIEVAAMLEAVKGPAPIPATVELPVGPRAVAALPSLVAALAAAPAEDRAALAELLTTVAAELRDQVPWLAQELREGDPGSRATAVRLLGRLATGTNEAVPALVAGLQHPDQTVRFAMVRTLSLIAAQTTAATEALLAVALEDESSAVRADAAASLNQLAAVQIATTRGPTLVAEAPSGRAGQQLLRIDPALSQ